MSERDDWEAQAVGPAYAYEAMIEDRRRRGEAHATGRPYRLTVRLGPVGSWDDAVEFKIGDVMFLGSTTDREALRARYAAAYPADYATPGPQPPLSSSAASVAERTGRALWIMRQP